MSRAIETCRTFPLAPRSAGAPSLSTKASRFAMLVSMTLELDPESIMNSAVSRSFGREAFQGCAMTGVNRQRCAVMGFGLVEFAAPFL